MRIWVTLFLILFVVFFGTAELYPWLANLLGSPLGALGAGMLLAIASNLDKFMKPQVTPQKIQPAPPTPPAPIPSPPPQAKAPPPPQPSPLSKAPQSSSPSRSISFTIKKPRA